MSECKTVTLRTRPLKNGMLSFYLDYYPGYRDQETMKTIRHEGLNIYEEFYKLKYCSTVVYMVPRA